MRTQGIRRTIFIAGLTVLCSCRGGCGGGGEADRALTVQGRLALFPAAAGIVAGIDVAQLRASPSAAKIQALAVDSQADEQTLAEFQRRTGFDPMKQLVGLTAAFPDDARRNGDFGLLLRADHFDETRLVAYVRDELQKTGDDLVANKRGRFTVWSSKRDPALGGFFVDERTFALGAGSWGARMAELADKSNPGDSAATNLQLVRLVERAAGTHALWAAAIVPAETKRSLAAQPGLAEAASIDTLSAAIDLGQGAQAMLVADVATAEAAGALATKASEALRDAKRNPQVLMLGLGPYLGGVTAHAADRTFEVRASLTKEAVEDLVGRIAAMVALARAGQAPGFAPPKP